jgi:hypothetical protein
VPARPDDADQETRAQRAIALVEAGLGEAPPARFLVETPAQDQGEQEQDDDDHGGGCETAEVGGPADGHDPGSDEPRGDDREPECDGPPVPAHAPAPDLAGPRADVVTPKPGHQRGAHRRAEAADVDQNRRWPARLHEDRWRREEPRVRVGPDDEGHDRVVADKRYPWVSHQSLPCSARSE